MAVNVAGVVAMVFFYLMVLGTGIWASFKSKRETKKSSADQMEMTLLGNRGINLVVGIFTMSATWIGGGYFIMLAEAAYTPSQWEGLQEVILFASSNCGAFIICGLVFAKPMRDRRFVTMLDPFHIKYGKGVACLFAFISVIADLIWVPTVLIPLGAIMSVILDLSYTVSIWISTAVAIIYTLLGGLYSVAYTDVIQLILMFFSAWLCVPFVLMSPAVSDVSNTTLNTTGDAPWYGTWESQSILVKVDTFLVLALGSLAYQPVHQRLLSASSSTTAKISCFAAAAALVIFAIPPAIVGVVAVNADWNKTSYGPLSPLERGEGGFIFAIALKCLTPSYIAIIGIGAVAAAVMSSTDSALLSAASTFSTNIYKKILRPQASQREMMWVIWIVVVVIGVAGAALASFQYRTLAMWHIGVTLTYVFMFPQLICVLFFKKANGYGSIISFLLTLGLRLLCGWPILGIPAVLHLPGGSFKDGVYVQHFPVNTLCMVFSFTCILMFSYLTALLFDKGIVPEAWDMLDFLKLPRKLPATEASNKDENLMVKEEDPHQDPSEPMMKTAC